MAQVSQLLDVLAVITIRILLPAYLIALCIHGVYESATGPCIDSEITTTEKERDR